MTLETYSNISLLAISKTERYCNGFLRQVGAGYAMPSLLEKRIYDRHCTVPTSWSSPASIECRKGKPEVRCTLSNGRLATESRSAVAERPYRSNCIPCLADALGCLGS